MIKKIIIYYLAFCVAIAPSFVFANTAGGTWQQVGSWQQGATTVWEAMKKEGDKWYNGYAKVKPTVKQVSSAILKGGKNATVAYALSVMVGEVVDYVLDPANNTVRIVSTDTTIYEIVSTVGEGSVGTVSTLERIACSANKLGRGNPAEDHYANFGNRYVLRCNNGYSFLDKKQTIPLDKVSAQVISNADAEHESSKRFVADVANANTTEKDKTAQFEATKTDAKNYVSPKDNTDTKVTAIPGTGEATVTNANTAEPTTADPTEKDLPAFCGWAPVVCETAQKLITLPDLFTKWYESAKESVKEFFKLKDEKTEIDIDVSNDERPDTNIRFNGICPAPVTLIDMNFFGSRIYHQFTYDKFCEMLQNLRPIIIAVGSFIALLIVGGVRTKDE